MSRSYFKTIWESRVLGQACMSRIELLTLEAGLGKGASGLNFLH
jgi:hypothetical protein